jgi:hypothetical protein
VAPEQRGGRLGNGRHPAGPRALPPCMLDAYVFLTRLNIDLLAATMRSASEAWEVLAPVAPWPFGAPARASADLTILGLDRTPPSAEDLRRAYRRAAKAAHPDAGGSADAFRAVAEAFGRLARGGVRPA